ncbi:hypothetical protein ACJRO7_011685 [Eucalyptus globulus]|uniref:DDE Tnp4 domain-containing protein n=1 Tax=Eucalyptus globulus TaxID=34317 RepID=A0ABD3LG75_EUCGL
MDDSSERENHEKDEEEYWQLCVAAHTCGVSVYQSIYGEKIPCMTSSYTGNAWLRELMDIDTNPERFYQMFRMDRIVNIDVAEMLGLFLHILGHNIGNRLAQERFQHSGETISRLFSLVLDKVCEMGANLIQPSDRQFKEVPKKIRNNTRFFPQFKDCIGAIDGTHIPAVVPTSEQLRFIGRKGIPTQNVMAVCNFNMEFTYVWAGWEGTAHDTRIFYEAIGRHDLQFPHPPKGKYYLVDAGYPNPTGYLGPYKEVRYHLPEFQRGPQPTGYKEVFNRAHSSLRSEIERAFGVLKKKWKILKGMPSYPYTKQVKIVIATMALHNYIRRNALNDTHFARVDLDPNLYTIDPDNVNGEGNASNDDVASDMACLRDQIAMHL